MMCVEDILDTLKWVKGLGGIKELFKRSDKTLQYISEWINNNPSFEFMNQNEKTRSNTGITFFIKDDWFKNSGEIKQREIMNAIFELLYKENVAYDINGYPKAPPSFRIWGGGTVEPKDINALLPWIDWAYNESKVDL
jgi:phosphoserine aminotransferase